MTSHSHSHLSTRCKFPPPQKLLIHDSSGWALSRFASSPEDEDEDEDEPAFGSWDFVLYLVSEHSYEAYRDDDVIIVIQSDHGRDCYCPRCCPRS